jgi:nucleotide-binding universal stress UspA family protein
MKEKDKKTLVAAVDTSAVSLSMFKEALVLASSLRAGIILVSVTPEYEGNMNRFFIKDADRQLSEPFLKILAEATDYTSSLGLKMTTIHRYGKPCDEIVAVAKEERASFIVLGSPKRLQVERMLLGRTIAEIIVSGPCDVLLIPEGSEIRFNKVMVGINGGSASNEAGQRAFEVAAGYNSEIHALYVVDIEADRALRYGVLRDAEQKAAEILKEYAAEGKSLGISVITEIRWNNPAKCLVDYAQKKEIDLIILGSKEDSAMFEMFWGSVVERVASQAACPILVAKKRKSGEEERFIP